MDVVVSSLSDEDEKPAGASKAARTGAPSADAARRLVPLDVEDGRDDREQHGQHREHKNAPRVKGAAPGHRFGEP